MQPHAFESMMRLQVRKGHLDPLPLITRFQEGLLRMSMRRFAPGVTLDMPFSNGALRANATVISTGRLTWSARGNSPHWLVGAIRGEENSRFLIDEMAPKFASLFSAWLQLR
jgi:hypothetical protein